MNSHTFSISDKEDQDDLILIWLEEAFYYTAGIYLFKINNGSSRTMCEQERNKEDSVTLFWCFYN